MISIENHNSTSSAAVNINQAIKPDFITFFLSENSKGDLYKVCQGITWYMEKLGSHRISRKALAKFADCHIDTVSSINMRLEEAGIFSIGRVLRKWNVYSTEFLHVLSGIFGYVNKYIQSSTSHNLTNLDLYLSYNNEESNSSTKVGIFSSIKNGIKSFSGKITSSLEKAPTRIAPVLCPSAFVSGLLINPNDYSTISTGQLFAEEERKREIAEINAKWAERARKDAEEIRLRKLEEANTPRVTKEEMLATLKKMGW